jgi:hypothetical protein
MRLEVLLLFLLGILVAVEGLQIGVPRFAEIKELQFSFLPARLEVNPLLPLSMVILKRESKCIALKDLGSALPSEWDGEVEIR